MSLPLLEENVTEVTITPFLQMQLLPDGYESWGIVFNNNMIRIENYIETLSEQTTIAQQTSQAALDMVDLKYVEMQSLIEDEAIKRSEADGFPAGWNVLSDGSLYELIQAEKLARETTDADLYFQIGSITDTTLQIAYGHGNEIQVDATNPIIFSSVNNINLLNLVKTSTAAGNVIDITNAGTGYDIKGNGSNWYVDADGNATFNNVVANGASIALTVNQTTNDIAAQINCNSDTHAVQINEQHNQGVALHVEADAVLHTANLVEFLHAGANDTGNTLHLQHDGLSGSILYVNRTNTASYASAIKIENLPATPIVNIRHDILGTAGNWSIDNNGSAYFAGDVTVAGNLTYEGSASYDTILLSDEGNGDTLSIFKGGASCSNGVIYINNSGPSPSIFVDNAGTASNFIDLGTYDIYTGHASVCKLNVTGNIIEVTQTANSGGISINKTATGSGNGITLLNAGTGYGIGLQQAGANDAVYINKSNTSTGHALNLINSGIGDAVNVQQIGNGTAVAITNSGTGSDMTVNSVIVDALWGGVSSDADDLHTHPVLQDAIDNLGLDTAYTVGNTISVTSARPVTLNGAAASSLLSLNKTHTGSANVIDIANSGSGVALSINCASTTRGDINLTSRASDPVSVTVGDVWYNNTDKVLRYQSTATVSRTCAVVTRFTGQSLTGGVAATLIHNLARYPQVTIINESTGADVTNHYDTKIVHSNTNQVSVEVGNTDTYTIVCIG